MLPELFNSMWQIVKTCCHALKSGDASGVSQSQCGDFLLRWWRIMMQSGFSVVYGKTCDELMIQSNSKLDSGGKTRSLTIHIVGASRLLQPQTRTMPGKAGWAFQNFRWLQLYYYLGFWKFWILIFRNRRSKFKHPSLPIYVVVWNPNVTIEQAMNSASPNLSFYMALIGDKLTNISTQTVFNDVSCSSH
jgi:hypothetical protein